MTLVLLLMAASPAGAGRVVQLATDVPGVQLTVPRGWLGSRNVQPGFPTLLGLRAIRRALPYEEGVIVVSSTPPATWEPGIPLATLAANAPLLVLPTKAWGAKEDEDVTTRTLDSALLWVRGHPVAVQYVELTPTEKPEAVFERVHAVLLTPDFVIDLAGYWPVRQRDKHRTAVELVLASLTLPTPKPDRELGAQATGCWHDGLRLLTLRRDGTFDSRPRQDGSSVVSSGRWETQVPGRIILLDETGKRTLVRATRQQDRLVLDGVAQTKCE